MLKLSCETQWEEKIMELMKRCWHTQIETPVKEFDKPFLMAVEDVFTISGRGTVATGGVERGRLNLNERSWNRWSKTCKKTVVTGMEMFRKNLKEVSRFGDAGLFSLWCWKIRVSNVVKFWNQVQLFLTQNSKAQIYVLTKDKGGRHTPFFKNYKPQFYFRTTDVTGGVEFETGR